MLCRVACWLLRALALPPRPVLVKATTSIASQSKRPTRDVMFRKILVAFDGSDPARKAFDVALDMAQKYQSDIHVVAVARPPEFAEEVETKAVVENASKHLERQLGALKSRAAHAGMNPHFRIKVGHPAEQIVRDAEEHAVELVLLGHRGHGMFERWLLGSISRTVIAYAPCAVMIVR